MRGHTLETVPRLRHRQVPIAYANALPGTCRRCGKPGADARGNRWHSWCWDAYREEANYRGAAERREGKHQRCAVCQRTDGEYVTVDGKLIRIKVERDHVIALALNGPRDWTGPRCQLHHQDKTTEDNARVKAWRARDPRARRAPRPPTRRNTMTASTKKKTSARAKKQPPRAHPLAAVARVLIGLVIVGASLVSLLDWWDELATRARTLASSALPYLVASACAVLAATVLTVWWRWRARARAEAIYRLTNAIAREARVDPGMLRIKVRRWSHGMPVWASCWYSETVDDEPGSETVQKIEKLIEKKLGIRLRFEWQPHRDTVSWRPLAVDPTPGAVEQPEPTAPVPDDSGRLQVTKQRIEDKVRALIKVKGDVVFKWGEADAVGPLRVQVSYPSTYGDETDETRQALVDGVNSKAPGRWRATWNTEENQVLFERRPPMRSNIPIPVEPSTDTWRLPFGVNEDGEKVVWNLKQFPHALISGETGMGKTVTLRAIIQAAVARGFVVFIIDPKRIEMVGLRGWPGVRVVATGTEQMIVLVEVLADLMDDRYAAIEAREADENHLVPVLAVIDEAHEWIVRVNAYWKQHKRGGGTEHPVVERFRSMTRMGRAGRVHMVIGIQRPDAKVLGGAARSNVGFRVALGPTDADSARMMFGKTDVGRDIPENEKGRCTVGRGSNVAEVQAYNTPDPFDWDELSEAERSLVEQLRRLAEEHASDLLANITPELIDELVEEMTDGQQRNTGRRSLFPIRQTATGRRQIMPPASPLPAGRGDLVRTDELAEADRVVLVLDGEPTDVTIVALDESPDSDDLVEVTYRRLDGTEGVAAFAADELVERKTL